MKTNKPYAWMFFFLGFGMLMLSGARPENCAFYLIGAAIFYRVDDIADKMDGGEK